MILPVFSFPGVTLLRDADVTGQKQRLDDQEDHGHPEHAKEFEVYPGVAVEVVHHVKIGSAHDQEEGDPA